MARLKTGLVSAILMGTGLAAAVPAHGAGFALSEISAQGMGNAFAGGGAVAEDASSVFANPASMTRLRSQIQASGHLIAPTFNYMDRGSVQNLPGVGTSVLLPGARANSAGEEDGVAPNLYYIRRINDAVTFGLALNAPFGLVTDYDSDWKGRYQTIRAEVIDLNLNPAIAWKVNEGLSVGAGVSINYIDAEFTQAVDVTAACLGATLPVGGVALAAGCTGFDGTNATLGAGQGANDGFLKQDGDDISYGFNLGLMYEFSEDTRISVGYRSQIHHKLDGNAEFTLPATVHGASAAVEAGVRALLANSGAKVGVSLPDSFSISAYHRFLPRFAVLADATWTGWSSIPELRFVYDNPGTLGGTAAEDLQWKDTWRLALGFNYYHSSALTFRTGVAYDQAPVSDPVNRTPRLPDNDRVWVAVGASYRFKDNLSADVGYAHLFIDDTNIFRTDSTGSLLNGVYESDADLFSVQVNYVFD